MIINCREYNLLFTPIELEQIYLNTVEYLGDKLEENDLGIFSTISHPIYFLHLPPRPSLAE